MLGCSFQAFSSSEPVLKFRSFSEFLLTSHFQVLVSTAKPCDSTDERLIIHHVSPPPPLPIHLHLRPAGDAGGAIITNIISLTINIFLSFSAASWTSPRAPQPQTSTPSSTRCSQSFRSLLRSFWKYFSQDQPLRENFSTVGADGGGLEQCDVHCDPVQGWARWGRRHVRSLIIILVIVDYRWLSSSLLPQHHLNNPDWQVRCLFRGSPLVRWLDSAQRLPCHCLRLPWPGHHSHDLGSSENGNQIGMMLADWD